MLLSKVERLWLWSLFYFFNFLFWLLVKISYGFSYRLSSLQIKVLATLVSVFLRLGRCSMHLWILLLHDLISTIRDRSSDSRGFTIGSDLS